MSINCMLHVHKLRAHVINDSEASECGPVAAKGDEMSVWGESKRMGGKRK